MPFPEFKRNTALAQFTTFRTGGPASYLTEVSAEDEVVDATRAAQKMGIPWRVIGCGSNILASDSGIDAAIIVFRSAIVPSILPGGRISVSGGLALSSLIEFMAKKGLGGLEHLAGIPGTVGGAVAGNAGAYGTAIGDIMEGAKVLSPDGDVRDVHTSEFKFSYRFSKIQETNEAVLSVTLKVHQDDPDFIKSEIISKILDRRSKHPDHQSTPTAGSFFKNPMRDGRRLSAGKLLEDAGCKAMRVGNAMPWHKHANIIVTDGPSKSSDVKKLAEQMKDSVEGKFGISLADEVRYIGF